MIDGLPSNCLEMRSRIETGRPSVGGNVMVNAHEMGRERGCGASGAAALVRSGYNAMELPCAVVSIVIGVG